MKKTIGILGGMGPEATAYFFGLITKKTKAETDQDHIPVVISSNPEIPPRTAAVLGEGPSLLPYLLEGVRVLKEAGADFIV
ncbi:MAG: aspartate/glutamate racemase family protein, partial [Candidatus Aminicenantes bacterium]|nr:aspartate/glutamate racemase family protein [Candidatus Aminicenantes bacterium]